MWRGDHRHRQYRQNQKAGRTGRKLWTYTCIFDMPWESPAVPLDWTCFREEPACRWQDYEQHLHQESEIETDLGISSSILLRKTWTGDHEIGESEYNRHLERDAPSMRRGRRRHRRRLQAAARPNSLARFGDKRRDARGCVEWELAYCPILLNLESAKCPLVVQSAELQRKIDWSIISKDYAFTVIVRRSSLSGSSWDSICGWLENSASLASEIAETRSKELSLPASLLESLHLWIPHSPIAANIIQPGFMNCMAANRWELSKPFGSLSTRFPNPNIVVARSIISSLDHWNIIAASKKIMNWWITSNTRALSKAAPAIVVSHEVCACTER